MLGVSILFSRASSSHVPPRCYTCAMPGPVSMLARSSGRSAPNRPRREPLLSRLSPTPRVSEGRGGGGRPTPA
eukprot:scaffold6607_cov60-Phaeocystis_antarctica.AAC.2